MKKTESDSARFASISAFENTLRALGDLVRVLEIDFTALSRPLNRCDLGRCRGTCCHDGVYLDRDEVDVLTDLLARHQHEIESIGAILPEAPIVNGQWRNRVSGPKTATRPEKMSENAENYPSHFPDTACVFLLNDARCALQQFAIDHDLDPWFYKPATCWLHPLSIEQPGDGSVRLTLHDPESDPQRFPDYDGFASQTPCGVSPASGGQPAWEILSPEIKRLGVIGGRDLLGEIRVLAKAQAMSRCETPQAGG
jgi:hypothetical protein